MTTKRCIRGFNRLGNETNLRILKVCCTPNTEDRTGFFPARRVFNINRRLYCTDDSAALRCSEKLMDAFRKCLFKCLKKNDYQPGNKVSIIGAGAVGMSCAITMLSKGVTNNIAIYDLNKKLCVAESLDLLHGAVFLKDFHLQKCYGIESTCDSRVVVVTAGARPQPNETRLSVSQKTADILKEVMPRLVQCSPQAVYIIASNPVDVMTWATQKITCLPFERCFSTGCHLDSARFRTFLAKSVGVAPSSVQAFVIGEHGSSSVPLWSSVSVGGVSFQKIIPNMGTKEDPMLWSKLHEQVVNAAFKIIAGKGYTNWAIGLTVSDLISAIFENSKRVLSLSTNAKGICGIKDDVFLSLPCIVSESGICGVMRPQLTKWEACALQKSAQTLLEAQCKIKF